MSDPRGTESLEHVPDVAILMATYEGEQFLSAQLESILSQTSKNWVLLVSDDSVSQYTREVLERFSERMGPRLVYRPGRQRGVVANFLNLVCSPEVLARFYAFADQDDVWDDDKLERAQAWLERVPQDVPALYCGRTRLIDEKGGRIGMSPLFVRQPGFGNALVQSLAGGNTMVFNEAARRLLMVAGRDVDVPVHDWWLYLLVSGGGGVVIYDALPAVSYRQHEGNVIGGNSGWLRRCVRLRAAFFSGIHKEWHDRNVHELTRVAHLLSEECRDRLASFAEGRARGLLPRLIALKRAGVYRQTWQGTLSLWVWILLGKV